MQQAQKVEVGQRKQKCPGNLFPAFGPKQAIVGLKICCFFVSWSELVCMFVLWVYVCDLQWQNFLFILLSCVMKLT